MIELLTQIAKFTGIVGIGFILIPSYSVIGFCFIGISIILVIAREAIYACNR